MPSWSSHREPDRPADRHRRILIPVNGTEMSRRAVEVGLTLARATDAKVTALYVTRVGANGASRKTAPRRQASRRNERAVLEEIGALAERYDVELRATTRANVTPDEAIFGESRRGYDLIVLGVSRRPGGYAVLRQHRDSGARPLQSIESVRRQLMETRIANTDPYHVDNSFVGAIGV